MSCKLVNFFFIKKSDFKVKLAKTISKLSLELENCQKIGFETNLKPSHN
jgi:hypothetical protein